MLMTSWLRLLARRLSFLNRSGRRRPRRRQRPSSLQGSLSLERLEDRVLLSALTVNSTLDNTTSDAVLTLREAVAVVNDGDVSDGIAGLGGRMLSAGELAQIGGKDPLGTNDSIGFDSALDGTPILLDGATLGDISVTADVVIVGNGKADTIIDAQNASRIFNVSGVDVDLTLDSLTLQNGQTVNENGGAILSTATGNSTLSIVDSRLTGNSATVSNAAYNADGGAIYAEYSHVDISDSTLTDNTAYRHGGAVAAENGNVAITDSTLTGNTTTTGSGGAVFADDGMVTVIDSTLSGNVADESGGAIYVIDGSVTVTGSQFVENAALSSRGGGIFAKDGMVSVEHSTFSGNTAGVDGGAIFSGEGNVTIANSQLSDNHAQGDKGGAVYSRGGVVTVTGSTLSGNSAGRGGGAIYFDLGNLTIINAQLSGNSAGARGGAIYSERSPVHVVNSTIVLNTSDDRGGGISAEDVTVQNSIIALNTAVIDETDIRADTLTIDHSLIGDNTGTSLAEDQTGASGSFVGTALNPIDPLLGPLKNNGGLVETHALLAGSLAIDSGDNSLAVDATNANAALTTDGRGGFFARISNTIVDMGAFEVQTFDPALLVVDNATDEFDGDLSDGDRSLREVIALANAIAGANTITFDSSIDGSTILLTMGQMTISEDVTITGNGSVNTIIDAQSSSRIFDITSDVGDVSITGMTLQNGFVFNADGGAIRSLQTGTLSITDSTLNGNTAAGDDGRGGAIAIGSYGASGIALNVTGSLLASNIAGEYGGAIYASDAAVSITDSTLTDNHANEDLDASGGALFIRGDNATITGSTLSGNTAIDHGGAIRASQDAYGTLSIQSSTLKGNQASSGGAVDVLYGDVQITGSTLADNIASGRGGAIELLQTNLTITDSTLRDNSATGSGGAVYSGSFTATTSISGSTFRGNQSLNGRGGAVNVESGEVTISDSVFDDNSTGDGFGGAVSVDDEITVLRSTFSNNTAMGDRVEGGALHATSDVTVIDSLFSGNSAIGEEAHGGAIYSEGSDVTIINSTLTGNSVNGDDARGGGVYGDS
ncbi:MAG: hypothetical protein KDA75_08730, partial [Planctomycetaceae bacterium]|nr:hypothetical protein [Planctomycetaceae bacterium]